MGFNFVRETFVIYCIVRKSHRATLPVKELIRKGLVLYLTLSSVHFYRDKNPLI